MMRNSFFTSSAAIVAVSLLLVGCVQSGNPFANPFGGPPPPPRIDPTPPPLAQPVPPPVTGGAKPTMFINASPKRVQDTIISRAQSRGTSILGANLTGVTLEIPLRQSTQVVEQQCGPHREGRTLRVYLATAASGAGTTVTEDRYVIDGGTSTCQLQLTDGDIQEANRSLGDLKAQSERPPVASQRGANVPGGAPLLRQ